MNDDIDTVKSLTCQPYATDIVWISNNIIYCPIGYQNDDSISTATRTQYVTLTSAIDQILQ